MSVKGNQSYKQYQKMGKNLWNHLWELLLNNSTTSQDFNHICSLPWIVRLQCFPPTATYTHWLLILNKAYKKCQDCSIHSQGGCFKRGCLPNLNNIWNMLFTWVIVYFFALVWERSGNFLLSPCISKFSKIYVDVFISCLQWWEVIGEK